MFVTRINCDADNKFAQIVAKEILDQLRINEVMAYASPRYIPGKQVQVVVTLAAGFESDEIKAMEIVEKTLPSAKVAR